MKPNTATRRNVVFESQKVIYHKKFYFCAKLLNKNGYDAVSDGIAEKCAVLVKRFSS
jgi:hypothetical protein